MVYTLIMNKKSYDLPKKTIAVVEAMDAVAQLDKDEKLSVSEKYQSILNFIASLVGEENTVKIFGSDALEEIDLSEILIAFRKIVDAYNKPMRDYENGIAMERFNQLPIEKLSKVAELAKQSAE